MVTAVCVQVGCQSRTVAPDQSKVHLFASINAVSVFPINDQIVKAFDPFKRYPSRVSLQKSMSNVDDREHE